jgi:hypothetical protein
VELSRTLVETGREPGSRNNLPARLDRAEPGRARLREAQLAEERRLGQAAASLAGSGLDDHVLDSAETVLLLRLLDLVLANRPSGAIRVPVVVTAFGVRLQLTPKPDSFTTVTTALGRLRIDGYGLTVARHSATGDRHE